MYVANHCSKLYSIFQDFYVNGGKIVQGDISADNGILHIVDSLLYPVGVSSNLYEYLETSSEYG